MTYRDDLWDVAVDQYGFVTTYDAGQLGIPPVELRKLASRGKLASTARGVYRFEPWPASDRDGYMLAVLWAGPGAVLSHDTALAVLDLCDVNPTQIEVTVPRKRRIRRSEGIAEVHRQDLDPRMVTWWEGIPTVTAETAILQGIDSRVPFYLLTQAIDTGRRRGTITSDAATRLRDRLTESISVPGAAQ